MITEIGGWELEEFTTASVVDGVEILLHRDGNLCMIVYPWMADPEREVRRAVMSAHGMGFKGIIEVGNLSPYSVPGSDTDDSDFLLLERDPMNGSEQ